MRDIRTIMADKSAHKQRTRERILAEAARSMRARGPDGIGVAELMKQAGLTHGGFYAHFKNRDDLVAAAIARMFEDSKAMVERHFSAGRPPREALGAMIDYYLSEGHCRRLDSGCPLAAIGSEAVRLPAAARDRFQEGFDRFRGAFVEQLSKLGMDDPEAIATSVVAELVGALSLARVTGDTTQLARSREQIRQRLAL